MLCLLPVGGNASQMYAVAMLLFLYQLMRNILTNGVFSLWCAADAEK
jgi:hypothetical protein